MKKASKKPESGDKKRPRGRPKAKNPRDQRLGVGFSREEIQQIRERAAAAGSRLTPWVRKRLGLDQTGYGKD